MWEAAEAYHRYMGRWSAAVAGALFDRAAPPDGGRYLDVGCGVGSLSRVVAEGARPELLVGIDTSAAFLDLARRELSQLVPVQGDARQMPFADATFDAAVSGLALNHVPDPTAALSEAARVVRTGGTLLAYVWDYDHPGFFLTWLWEGLESIRGQRNEHDERGRWPVCTEAGLTELATRSALSDIQVAPIVIDTPFRDVEELWQDYLLGVGPSGRAVSELDPSAHEQLRSWFDERWPASVEGPERLTARALTLVATAP